MRDKIIRNIPVFFLWLAGLAINAHMIIPHDHHQMESVAGDDDSCPVSANKTKHHTGFPVHCHFCNDLTSEKAVTILLFRNIQFSYFIIDNISEFSTIKPHSTGIKNFEFIRQPFRSDILVLSLLRAPPFSGQLSRKV